MNKGEKKIVIGGVVVTALVAGGFTLSQGPLGTSDDNYQSPPEQIVMSEQSNTSSETVKEDDEQIEQLVEQEEIQEETIKTDTYDINKAYKKGEVVVYNGIEYKAKWWTKGDSPQKCVDWEEVVVINEDGSENYAKGKHYLKGTVVVYEGNTYQAKWWTESTPGSNDSWMIIN